MNTSYWNENNIPRTEKINNNEEIQQKTDFHQIPRSTLMLKKMKKMNKKS